MLWGQQEAVGRLLTVARENLFWRSQQCESKSISLKVPLNLCEEDSILRFDFAAIVVSKTCRKKTKKAWNESGGFGGRFGV